MLIFPQIFYVMDAAELDSNLFLLEAKGCQLVVHVEFLTEYQCDSMFKDIIIQP